MPIEIDNLKKILEQLNDLPANSPLPKSNLIHCVNDWYFPRLFGSALLDRQDSEWEFRITEKIRSWFKIDVVDDARIAEIVRCSFQHLADADIDNSHWSESIKKEIYNFKATHRLLPTNPNAAVHQHMQRVIDLYQHQNRPVIDLSRFNNPQTLLNQSIFQNLPPQPVEGIDPELLIALLSNADSAGIDLRRLLNYVRTFPQAVDLQNFLNAEQINAVMQRKDAYLLALEQAIKEESNLEAIIASGKIPQEQAQLQASQALETMAGECSVDISQLAVGQRKLIIGGIGAVAINLKLKSFGNDEFFNILQGLLTLENSGATLANIIGTITPKVSAGIAEMVPEEAHQALRGIVENGLMQHLFSGLSQSLVEGKPLSKRILWAPVEWGRQQLEETVSHYCTVISREVAEKLSASMTPELLEQLRIATIQNRLGETVSAKLTLFFSSKLQEMHERLVKTISNITGSMPRYVADVFRLMDLGELGTPEQPIWFEFERQADSRFTVSVYATGAAVLLHPHVEKKDGLHYQIPFQIRNVDIEKLDAEHMLRLLSYRAWPEWRKGVRYTVHDVYKGLLATLGGEIVPISESSDNLSNEAQKYSGAVGLYRFYTQHRLFPTSLPADRLTNRDKQKLFRLSLGKKAIRDMWTHVVHTPNYLKRNKEAKNALLKASEELGKLATELFEDGAKISLEEYVQIFATVKVVSNTFAALEQEDAVRQQKKGSVLIPPELMPHLHGLIASTRGSKFVLETIKDLLTGALGEEISGSIDAAIEDIFPEPIVFPSEPTVEQSRLRSIINWAHAEITSQAFVHFGLSVELLRNPTKFKIAFCVSRIAFFILFPVASIKLSITLVAARALSSFVEARFPTVTGRLSRLKKQLFAQTVAHFFLSKEQRVHFDKLLNSWRGSLLRSGKIQYNSNPMPSSPTIRSLQWKIINIVRDAPPQVAHEEASYNSDYLCHKNLIDELNRWLEVCGKGNADESSQNSLRRLRFLNGQLKQLPVPLAGNKGDRWDVMSSQEAEVCMEKLAEIALILYKTVTKVNSPSQESIHRAVINLYKTLAIIDKLARKFPETHLEGFTVNAWALAWWSKNGLFRILDYEYLNDLTKPKILTYHTQLLQLQAYFEIDPKHPYTDEQAAKSASNCLFFENENPGTVSSSGCAGEGTTAYFNVLMQDPKIKGLMAAMGINENSFPLDKYSLLYRNAGNQQIKAILPRAIHLMRLIQFLAGTLADHTYGSPVIIDIESVDEFRMVMVREESPFRSVLQLAHLDYVGNSRELDPLYKELPGTFHMYAVNNISRSMYSHRDHLPLNLYGNVSLARRGHELQPISYLGMETTVLNNYMHGTVRTPRAIIHTPSKFELFLEDDVPIILKTIDNAFRNVISIFSDSIRTSENYPSTHFSNLSDETRRVIEMIRTHKPDEAVRAISFFMQNLDKLGNISFLTLLSSLLFYDQTLYRQLAAYPEFCKTLGQFFHRAQEQLALRSPEYNESNQRLWSLSHGIKPIVTLGVLVKMSVEALVPGGGRWFPDYRRMISEDAELSSISPLLALPYLSLDYHGASQEVRREAITDICRGIGRFTFAEEIGSLCNEVVSLWSSAIEEELRDLPFRNQVLSRAAGSLFPANEVAIWEGEYPVYTSGDYTADFRSLPVITSKDQLEKNAIHGALQSILGRECRETEINLLLEGKYSIPEFQIIVEIHRGEDARSQKLIFRKKIEGSKYYWVDIPETLQEGAHITYWLKEGSSNGFSEIAILEAGELKGKRTIRCDANQYWQPRQYEISESSLQVNGVPCKKFDIGQVGNHGLSLLSWFQPLSSIDAYYAIMPPYALQRITFFKLKLSFDIKVDEQGNQKAMDQTGEFFIAPVQHQSHRYPVLATLGSYLLLENDRGDKKVLIPSDSLRAQTASIILGLLAGITLPPFVKAQMESWLSETQAISQNGAQTYNTYTFDNDGKLTSDDPLAILHLLTMNLGSLFSPTASIEDVIHYLTLFEMRIEEKNVYSDEVFDFSSKLELCSPFVNNNEFTRLTLRLAALRTRFVQTKDDKKVMGAQFLSFIAMQWNYTRFNPEEPFAVIPIDERQEYAVLRSISRSAETLLAQITKDKRIAFVNEYGIGPIASAVLVLPSVARRYDFLRYKYNPMAKDSSISFKSLMRHMWQEAMSNARENGEEGDESSLGVHFGLLWDKAFREVNRSYGFDFEIVIPETWESIPLSFSKITSQHLKKYFFQYYRLAKGEMPAYCMQNEERKAQFNRDSKQFKATLELMLGKQFGDRGDDIINYLRKAALIPKEFPPADECERSFSEYHRLKQYTEVLEKELSLFPREYAEARREKHKEEINDAFQKMTYNLGLILSAANKSTVDTLFSAETFNTVRSFVQTYGQKVMVEASAYGATGLLMNSVAAPLLMPLGRIGLLAYRSYPKVGALQQMAQSEREEMEKTLTVSKAPMPQDAQRKLFEVDDQLEKAFKSLLNDHFRLVPPEADRKERAHRRIGPLIPPNEDRATVKDYAKVNKDLEDYYNNPFQPEPVYEPKSHKDFYQLKLQSEAARDRLQVQTNKFEADILQFTTQVNHADQPDHVLIPELFRQGLQKRHREPHAYLLRLLQNLLSPDHELLELTRLKPEQLPQLKFHLYHYLIAGTRLQQLERALTKLDQNDIPGLTYELSRKRAYKIHHPNPTENDPEIHERFIAGYLLLEYGRNVMIWPHQLVQLQKQLLMHFEHDNICVQLPTGSGKSAVGTYVIGGVLSTRKQAIWHIRTDALKTSSSKEIINITHKVRGAMVFVFQMDRYKPINAVYLSELYQKIAWCIHFGHAIVSGKRDPESFELRFIEEVWKYSRKRERNMAKEEELLAFAHVLALIRTICADFDELQKLERALDELNFPLDESKEYLEKKYSRVMMHFYHLLLDDPILKQLDDLKDQRQPLLDPKVYDEMRPRIAQLLKQNPIFEVIPENQDRFAEYLCKEESPIPDFVQKSKYRSEMALARGLILELHSETRKGKLKGNFGRSNVLESEFDIPFIGNNVPAEGSTFRSQFEAGARTYRDFAHTGLTEKQTKKLHRKMHQTAVTEAIEKQIPKEATEAAQAFYNWCQAYFKKLHPDTPNLPCRLSDFPENLSAEKLTELTAAFNESNAARLEYAYWFGATDVPYFQKNLSSTSQNFVSMFGKNVGGTASPNDDETFYRGTQTYIAPGTTGAFLDHFGNVTTPETIIEIDAKTPKEAATAIIERIFTQEVGASYMADPAGLLNGLDNQAVAQMMLEHCTWYDAVVFFSKEGAQLILERGSNTPKPLSQSKVSLKQRCGYFDEINALGQDIPMDPAAVVVGIINGNINREQAQQGLIGRFRNCKQGGKQRLYTVINKNDRVAITANEAANSDEIISLFQTNETRHKGKNNYRSAPQQIYDVSRRAVLTAMIDRAINEDIPAMMQCFRPFESLFVHENVSDPFVLFGHPKKAKNPYSFLNQIKENEFDRLVESKVFKESELKDIWSKQFEPLGKGTYPETVSVYENGIDQTAYEFGAAQEVVLTQEQNQNRQNIVEQQQHQNQCLENMAYNEPLLNEELSEETPWPTNVNYFANVDWLRLSPVATKSNFQSIMFYRVDESIKNLGVPFLREVHSAFQGSMWWTHNFMGIQILSKSLFPPGAARHHPILEILVVCKRDAQGQIVKITTGAITQNEADVWRKRFAEDRRVSPDKRDPTITIGLFDLGASCVADCGYNKLTVEELFRIEKFRFDVNRWKFLAAQVNIKRNLPDSLDQDKADFDKFKLWFAANDQEKMKKAFVSLHRHRGISSIEGSDMDHFFIRRKEQFLLDKVVA